MRLIGCAPPPALQVLARFWSIARVGLVLANRAHDERAFDQRYPPDSEKE